MKSSIEPVRVSSIIEGVFMIVLMAITAIFQSYIKNSFNREYSFIATTTVLKALCSHHEIPAHVFGDKEDGESI